MTVRVDSPADQLLELQVIDRKIWETKERIDAFAPRMEAVEAPAQKLEADAEVTANKVRDLRLEERRLRLAAEEKRARAERLEERATLIRTVREEEALRKETEIVQRSLDQDEQDIVNVLDQIGTLEDRREGQRVALEEAHRESEPLKRELEADRESARAELVALEERRDRGAEAVDERWRSVYDNLVRGGRRVAVAPMTDDGACGACFSMIPLQVQQVIRTGGVPVRCEACGVIAILGAADPAESQA